MNTIHIQNRTGFNNADKTTFIINGLKYSFEQGIPNIIALPDDESIVQIQMKYHRLASSIQRFDLKNGKDFIVRCNPLIGFNAENNLKLLISIYLLLMVLAIFTGYWKALYLLLFVGILSVAYFLTIGRGNFFVIQQEESKTS